MNILHPRNWSRYSRMFSGNKEGLGKFKRVILLSQFALFGSVIGVLHALEDLLDGLLFMPMMDGIMAGSIFACYLLNEYGKHKAARIILLSFLNVFFFVYSSLSDPDLGIYLYYFSWVGLAAVLFEISENFYRYFFIALSIALTLLLFATNFNAFGTWKAVSVDIERSFILNFVSAIGVLVFFIVFMIHINEEYEMKLIQLAQEVRFKNANLEKANRELDRFFYSASHDLKVPLLDIKGAINTAMSEVKDEKMISYFVMLKERADKLDNFLQDIIDYSRNTQTGLRLEPVDILALVDEVIDNFTFVKGADKIYFYKEIRIQDRVEIDRVRLMIILNNIFSNAIKYHRLDQKVPWIRIIVSYSDHFLNLSIADNGQGIEEDLVPKIFDMFFRGTNLSRGSGLGLYIVKETVEKMGGNIVVKSKAGSGTTFFINLPAHIIPASVHQATIASSSPYHS